MTHRLIKRIAFLQEYRNRPESLKDLIPEVAAKGYRHIGVSGILGQEPVLSDLAAEAEQHGLGVAIFTGFMKYQQAHLAKHPEQRLVLSSDVDVEDQDSLAVRMGCPFNETFQRRYMKFLEALGKIPNVNEVWINDEATLGVNEGSLGCYCHVCQKDWEKTFGGSIPKPPFADAQEKINFVNWRFRRWNNVHGKMKQVLNQDRPVRAVWLTSPRPCWDVNPWISAIDFSGVVDAIDGLMTDPYYTFHLPNVGGGLFKPAEVYLTECSRFMHAYTNAEDKASGICAQGFSHPTFTRPMDKRDGWWAAVLPAALGVDDITAYTYLLQRTSPMQKTYEQAFRLDPFFAQTRPAPLVAVVDSLETQAFDPRAVGTGPESWRMSRMLALGEVARHHGLSYTYLPSTSWTPQMLQRFPVVVLPNVTCLSGAAAAALQVYVEIGGVLIAAGETATRNELGQTATPAQLSQVFGINMSTALNTACEFTPTQPAHAAFGNLPWPDKITGQISWGGDPRPALGLSHVVPVEDSDQAEVLATFSDTAGPVAGRPALTMRQFGAGTAVFLAGIPTRTYTRAETNQLVLNFAGRVISQLITALAGDRSPLIARNFPPHVPLQEVRPLDSRWMPTMEFLPSIGENLYLATVPSYFREPFEFQIQAKLAQGKQCREVRELVSDQPVANPRQAANDDIEIDATFTQDDFLKVYGFFLE